MKVIKFNLQMQEETAEHGLFAIALRGIIDTQGAQQLEIVTKESENECVDILCRTSNPALFLNLYTDFKSAGRAWREYTENLPRRIHSFPTRRSSDLDRKSVV